MKSFKSKQACTAQMWKEQQHVQEEETIKNRKGTSRKIILIETFTILKDDFEKNKSEILGKIIKKRQSKYDRTKKSGNHR